MAPRHERPGRVSAALELRGLSKSFAGSRALDDVSLTVEPGEVHGLLGENGSGKSTLIKVLAGYHVPESGELEVYGRPVKLPLAPGEFRSLGLEFVHQDLGLIPSLTVVENLRIGEISSSEQRFHISWRSERRRARDTFSRYGLELDPAARVSELRPVERALLAIVRAVEGMRGGLAGDASARGVLVLDEPTVFLPRAGIDQLFALVREVTEHGASVLFVSHDLDEVKEITDRVTVLRDGRNAGTVSTAATHETELVELIIGRKLETMIPEHQDTVEREVGCAVEDLTSSTVHGISVEVRRGEVLGVTGLAGSGFEEVPYLLFGALPCRRGRLNLGTHSFDLTSLKPAAAIRAGIALIPGDRQNDASIGSLPAADNMTLQVLRRYWGGAKLDRARMVRDSGQLMRDYDVRPPDPRMTYSSFSGGNQQKALMAKWLQTTPSLLLLHEPTQGVDIGARQIIFAVIRDAAAQGTSVVCGSSDYEQLAIICDRVLVFGRGRIVKEIVGEAITKERITEQCYNTSV